MVMGDTLPFPIVVKCGDKKGCKGSIMLRVIALHYATSGFVLVIRQICRYLQFPDHVPFAYLRTCLRSFGEFSGKIQIQRSSKYEACIKHPVACGL